MISSVIEGSALLNPGKNLVEEQSSILDELIPSIKSGTGDGVSESSNDSNLTVLILAKQSSFQLHGIESWDEMRLTKTMKIRVCRLSGIQMTVDI